jgi:hypothetical protein
MATVTITRAFSGFTNVADTMLVGAHDDVAGTVAEYILPEGYTVDSDRIFDNHGFECFIETGAVLVSRAGPAADVALVAA